MMRILPRPLVSGAVLVLWLVLAGDLSPASLAGGLALAWVLPMIAARFDVAASSARRPWPIARLAVVVIVDIVRSNLVVARLVLRRPLRLHGAFVWVPADTDHPLVLDLLASIITMTPGTVSARVEAGGTDGRPGILVHVLDCADAGLLVAGIKARYETPLMEIFGCSTSQ